LRKGLDHPNQLETAGEIGFYAQAFFKPFWPRKRGKELRICPSGESVMSRAKGLPPR
jgi:hypothetical protein